jgi:branched-chain amino acid transport system ATP-binding protein
MRPAAAQTPGLALAARGIVHGFDGLAVLNDITIELKRGERATLIGPNGAGKTTLFNVICGLLRPQRGRIILNGIDVSLLPAHRRARLGIGRGFQITNLFPDLTVAETATIAAIRRARADYAWHRPRALDALAAEEIGTTLGDWGFADLRGTRVRELSYGEQRRLDICLALLMKPDLLLLDEPTAGLSPRESADIVATLRNLPRHLTCLVVTHDLEFGFSIADRVIALHQGRIVTEGSPQEVRSDDLLRAMYF